MKPLSSLFFIASVLCFSCNTTQLNPSIISLFPSDSRNRIHLSQYSNFAKQYQLEVSCSFDISTLPVDIVYLNEDTIPLKQGHARLTAPTLDSLRLKGSFFGQPLSLRLADRDGAIFYRETIPVPEALEFTLAEGQYPTIFPGSKLHWNVPTNRDQTLYFYLDYDPIANPRHNNEKGLRDKIRWLVKVPDIGYYSFEKKDFPRSFPDDVKLAMRAIRIIKEEVPIGESQMNLMLHSEVQGFFVYKQDQNLN